jgi:hypothetical protein
MSGSLYDCHTGQFPLSKVYVINTSLQELALLLFAGDWLSFGQFLLLFYISDKRSFEYLDNLVIQESQV